jgi:hypothetical protein
LARERQRLETLTTVCSEADWHEICARAVADAKRGDHRAREWLSKYVLGEPDCAGRVLHAHLHAGKDNPFLAAGSDAVIEAKSALHKLMNAASDPNSDAGNAS